jgi:hypothetical protein
MLGQTMMLVHTVTAPHWTVCNTMKPPALLGTSKHHTTISDDQTNITESDNQAGDR